MGNDSILRSLNLNAPFLFFEKICFKWKNALIIIWNKVIYQGVLSTGWVQFDPQHWLGWLDGPNQQFQLQIFFISI